MPRRGEFSKRNPAQQSDETEGGKQSDETEGGKGFTYSATSSTTGLLSTARGSRGAAEEGGEAVVPPAWPPGQKSAARDLVRWARWCFYSSEILMTVRSVDERTRCSQFRCGRFAGDLAKWSAGGRVPVCVQRHARICSAAARPIETKIISGFFFRTCL